MKKTSIYIFLILLCCIACSKNEELNKKGFQVIENIEDDDEDNQNEIFKDTSVFQTKPSSVLLTANPNIRFSTIYKVNLRKRDSLFFIGSDKFHFVYDEMDAQSGNNWHGKANPGLEAVYGYNMVNIALYEMDKKHRKFFFDKPVLIKTLYYPTFSKDTLNNKPIQRNYFLTTVYDEDSNKDGYINLKDLRRMYLFSINGAKEKNLVPFNYSVFKSEYDPANDYMYVFANLDKNNNGSIEQNEPTHIFWIDLKNPNNFGRLY